MGCFRQTGGVRERHFSKVPFKWDIFCHNWNHCTLPKVAKSCHNYTLPFSVHLNAIFPRTIIYNAIFSFNTWTTDHHNGEMWWLCWYWCWWQKAQHGSQKLAKELTQTPLFLLSIWCCFCQFFWRDNQRPIPGLRKLGKELAQTPLSPENQKLDTGRNAKSAQNLEMVYTNQVPQLTWSSNFKCTI